MRIRAGVVLLTVWASLAMNANSQVLFFEDFESLPLGPNVEEGLGQVSDFLGEPIWSPTGPDGWTNDNSRMPGVGTAQNGVDEFLGFTWVDSFWYEVDVDAGQGRDTFGFFDGIVMVADSDEWDDSGHPAGPFDADVTTPTIPVAGAGTSLEFNSAWRPEGDQTGIIYAAFDGGARTEIGRFSSDPDSPDFVDHHCGDLSQCDNEPDIFSFPVNAPAGAQNVNFTFSYSGSNNWFWIIDDLRYGNYREDFEGVALQEGVEEVSEPTPEEAVWTKQAPAGWSIEDQVPGMDEPDDNNGVTEWIGWSFTDKDWWVGVAGDQRRSEFTNGEGTVAVADPDEWDDAPHPPSGGEGWYNTWLTTPEISVEGVEAGTIELTFDSSWRPEFDSNYQQSANITVSFDGGDEVEILRWLSDPNSDDFKEDAPNETITLEIDNPEGASNMVITFGMFDAGNDWWWALDNIQVTGDGDIVIPLVGDFNGNGEIDAGDLDALAAGMAANDPAFDLDGDGDADIDDRAFWLNEIGNTWSGDSNFDGEFGSGDLVTVFTAGKFETGEPATWAEGDWNGDGVFGSGDLVFAFTAGGFELGPRPAAAVPEPSSVLLVLLGVVGLASRRIRR